jgi:hypothetical protein
MRFMASARPAVAPWPLKNGHHRAGYIREGTPAIGVFLQWTVDLSRLILLGVQFVKLPALTADELPPIDIDTTRRPT